MPLRFWRRTLLPDGLRCCTLQFISTISPKPHCPCSSLPGFSGRYLPLSLPSFLSLGSDLHCSIPFQLPLAPFSLSYCSSFDKCLISQVLFLPYGILCAQADKLYRGWNLQNRIKDYACLVCARLWADIPQHPTNQMKLVRAKDAVP